MGIISHAKVAKRKSFLAKSLEDYASNATVHGISYVFDKTTSVVERFIWFIIVFAFGCIAILLVYKSYTDWQENQVITTLKTVAKPVSELKFPAITICGSGQHLGLVEKVLTNNFQTWNKRRGGSKKTATLKEDFALYMQEVFQIDDKEINILDILSTMISPSPEVSGSNAVRENQVVCSKKQEQDSKRLKRTTGDLYPNIILLYINSVQALLFV